MNSELSEDIREEFLPFIHLFISMGRSDRAPPLVTMLSAWLTGCIFVAPPLPQQPVSCFLVTVAGLSG